MIFGRIVVGVDGSDAGYEALGQAMRLLAPEGRILAVVVCDTAVAVHAGWDAAKLTADIRAEAHETLENARRQLGELPGAECRLVDGHPTQTLLDLVRRESATMVALGDHGRSRAAGILLGGVATTLLHEASCSIFVARRPPDVDSFPRAVVVGMDGSREATVAAEVAGELGDRFGVPVRSLVAERGKPVDLEGLRAAAGPLEWFDGKPVDALVSASSEADIVVVGSRGLHGVGALGSVSEQVAHKAVCSVLVVRPVVVDAAHAGPGA